MSPLLPFAFALPIGPVVAPLDALPLEAPAPAPDRPPVDWLPTEARYHLEVVEGGLVIGADWRFDAHMMGPPCDMNTRPL